MTKADICTVMCKPVRVQQYIGLFRMTATSRIRLIHIQTNSVGVINLWQPHLHSAAVIRSYGVWIQSLTQSLQTFKEPICSANPFLLGFLAQSS